MRLQAQRFRVGGQPAAQPWFGVGPVWEDRDGRRRTVGVSVSVGRRAFGVWLKRGSRGE